jgi:hypothetical protein
MYWLGFRHCIIVIVFLPGPLDIHNEIKQVGLINIFKVKLDWKILPSEYRCGLRCSRPTN